jgi:hypothetical protein
MTCIRRLQSSFRAQAKVAAFDSPKLNDDLFRIPVFFRRHTGIAALVIGILLMVRALAVGFIAAMALPTRGYERPVSLSLFIEARIFFKRLAGG